MTVTEAKEKVCPFLHLATQHRKDGEIYFSYTYCQVSKCMAWVDTGAISYNETKDTTYGFIKSLFKDIPTGYCVRIGNV